MADTTIVTVCEKSHRRVPLSVADVPHSQKGAFRHRCAGCAYEQGYREGYDAALAVLQKAAPLPPVVQTNDDEPDPDTHFQY